MPYFCESDSALSMILRQTPSEKRVKNTQTDKDNPLPLHQKHGFHDVSPRLRLAPIDIFSTFQGIPHFHCCQCRQQAIFH